MKFNITYVVINNTADATVISQKLSKKFAFCTPLSRQFIIPLREDIMRVGLHAFAKILSAVFLGFSQNVTIRY